MTDREFKRMQADMAWGKAVTAVLRKACAVGQLVANSPPAHLDDQQKAAWFLACQKITDELAAAYGWEGLG